MSWRALTEDDLKSRLSGSELATFRATATIQGDQDPVQAVLDQVTDQVRGYIVASPDNRLGLAGTIPLKLIGTAVALAVLEVMARSGGKILDLGGHRKDSARSAESLLKDVAGGRFKLEVPTSLTTETIGFVPPTFESNRVAHYGYAYEEGI